ncbi:MAG: hypothetical protein WBH08_06930 [Methanothrix sp.]
MGARSFTQMDLEMDTRRQDRLTKLQEMKKEAQELFSELFPEMV